jgi:hypothetical protein
MTLAEIDLFLRERELRLGVNFSSERYVATICHRRDLYNVLVRISSESFQDAVTKAIAAILGETKLNRAPQRQDSLADQLQDVAAMADHSGCYDAADWIRNRNSEGAGE